MALVWPSQLPAAAWLRRLTRRDESHAVLCEPVEAAVCEDAARISAWQLLRQLEAAGGLLAVATADHAAVTAWDVLQVVEQTVSPEMESR